MLNKFRLFYAYVSDLLADARVQSMARIEHHTQRISCLDHCLFVSYVSFALSAAMNAPSRARDCCTICTCATGKRSARSTATC